MTVFDLRVKVVDILKKSRKLVNKFYRFFNIDSKNLPLFNTTNRATMQK